MNKILVFTLMVFITLFGFNKRAAASVPGLEMPQWHLAEASVIRTGDNTDELSLRFTFKPLVAANFNINVKFIPPAGIKNMSAGTASLKSTGGKAVSADFPFEAAGSVYERGMLYYETDYPAGEVIKAIHAKYGSGEVLEVKQLAAKAAAVSKEYTGTLSLNFAVDSAQCSINPCVLFKMSNGYFRMSPEVSFKKAEADIADFDKRYAQAFELSDKEFIDFLSMTGCELAFDIARYSAAKQYMLAVAKNVSDGAILADKIFHALDLYSEVIKRAPASKLRAAYEQIDLAVINAAGFFNQVYIDESSADKKAAIVKIKRLSDLIAALASGDAELKKAAGGYVAYNMATLMKAAGEIDYKRFYDAAEKLNPSLIAPKK